MKKLPILLFASLLGATLPALAQKDQPASADPFIKETPAAAKEAIFEPNCMLVLEVYAMDKNDALAVLEAGIGSAARYRQVRDLEKGGKARLEILTAVNNKSGKKAIMESINEVRYPTVAGPGSLSLPINHETRNIGDTLEFEVALNSDGRTCNLSIVHEHLGLPGGQIATASSIFHAPPFSSRKVTTNTVFPLNAAHFLGTLTPASERGAFGEGQDKETSLAFVRLNVTEPGKDQKPPAKPLDWSALNLEYSFYSLDRAAARELLAAAPSLDGPWKAVQALLGEKKANFEHVISVQTRSGDRSITEEMQEINSLFDDGAVPQPSKISGKKTSSAGKNAADPNRAPESNSESGPSERFGKRNGGLTVEVEAIPSADGLAIFLDQVIQSVTQVDGLEVAKTADDFSPHVMFETRCVRLQQTLLAGHKILAGTFNPADLGAADKPAARTWLVFVRATPNEP